MRISTTGAASISRRLALPGGPAALVFVDVDGTSATADSVLRALETLPPSLTAIRHLIIRWPVIEIARTEGNEQELLELAREVGGRSGSMGLGQTHTGVVRFRVGQDPILVWDVPPTDVGTEPGALLGRCLRAELAALLDHGGAIWHPTTYHYALPSGDHTRFFVRVSDAMRNPRDVRVLSSWLVARLTRGVTFAADSATLVPLLTDLRSLCDAAGLEPGSDLILDELPRTRTDLFQAIQDNLRTSSGDVLALLSVSSSGGYRDKIREALAQAGELHGPRCSLVVMVDKTPSGADRDYVASPRERNSFQTWFALPGELPRDTAEHNCPDCRDYQRAQIAHIDPRSFQAMALPAVEKVTPNFRAAQRATSFWDAADQLLAVGTEVAPAVKASLRARPKDHLLGIRLFTERMLGSDELARAVETALAVRAEQGQPLVVADGIEYDGVVISREEDSTTFRRTLSHLLPRVGIRPDVPVIAMDPDGSPAVAVTNWRRVLVFSTGSLSGYTMRQLLLSVQGGWRNQRGREIGGLVLVARPLNVREWESLSNSFGQRLHAVWKLYLPWRSPLLEESALLDGLVQSEMPAPVQNFWRQRRALVSPRVRDWHDRLGQFRADADKGVWDAAPDPRSIFWGSSLPAARKKVRTQSLYGFEVSSITAYAAVGAAMHAARQEGNRYDPRRRVFEFPAIARSYYDGPILAAVLRWAEPRECWWGSTAAEAVAVLDELLTRTTAHEDQLVLFPELLLAAAQGKIPAEAAVHLADVVRQGVSRWAADERIPVDLGIHILARQHPAHLRSPSPPTDALGWF